MSFLAPASRRPIRGGRGASALLLCAFALLCLPWSGALGGPRRKRTRAPKVARAERPGRCDDSTPRCQSQVVLQIEQEGKGAVPAFTYRVRFGDEEIEGSCPAAQPQAAARCLPSGVAVAGAPRTLDVFIEAGGARPLIQSLTPSYDSQRDGCGGTCQTAEVRLMLSPQRQR